MAFKPLTYCDNCGHILVKMLNNQDEWVIVHLSGYKAECVEDEETSA